MKWIADNNITENPWFNETFYLKFCRARKFDLEKVIIMFTDYIKYREENGLDTIVSVSIRFFCSYLNIGFRFR